MGYLQYISLSVSQVFVCVGILKLLEYYQLETKGGYPVWTRHWLIPVNYRNEFFIYWKGNSFKLKDKGYGVKKVDNDWFLTETQDNDYHDGGNYRFFFESERDYINFLVWKK